MVRPEDQRSILEQAAKEIGKPVWDLSPEDLVTHHFKFLGDKSLHGLHAFYREKQPGSSYSEAMALMMHELGIEGCEFYGFDMALHLFKSRINMPYWSKVKPEDRIKFLEIAARELRKDLSGLTTKDMYTKISGLGNKSLFGLLYQYRGPNESDLQALKKMKRELGIMPNGNGGF